MTLNHFLTTVSIFLLLLASAQAQISENAAPAVVQIPTGTYHFYFEKGLAQTHFVSNHDQENPKSVGLSFQNLKNVTFDGNGSTFVFHGKMLPVVLKNCENCTLKNFHIDFDHPAICQVKVLENTPEGLTVDEDAALWLADYEGVVRVLTEDTEAAP